MRLKILTIATVFSLSILSIGASAQTNSAGELEKRIQQREAKIKEKLTAAQQTRLKARCKAAQIKIAVAEKVATTHHDNQDKKISSLISRLDSLSQKQKEKGADTAALDTAIANISLLGQSVDTAYQNYISALDDSSAIDCHADPSGFKASLLDARGQFQALKTARQELRKALKDTLLPVLKDFKPKKGDS